MEGEAIHREGYRGNRIAEVDGAVGVLSDWLVHGGAAPGLHRLPRSTLGLGVPHLQGHGLAGRIRDEVAQKSHLALREGTSGLPERRVGVVGEVVGVDAVGLCAPLYSGSSTSASAGPRTWKTKSNPEAVTLLPAASATASVMESVAGPSIWPGRGPCRWRAAD